MSQPEFWMRGIAVEGVSPALQPVAHALLQAVEDLEGAASGLSPEALWMRPGGAASTGFHLRHLAGSLDRLTTYARGESLTEAQLAALRSEGEPGASADELLAHVRAAVDRARLPSSVRGLLYHAGEHTSRHAGQAATTAKVVRGLAGG